MPESDDIMLLKQFAEGDESAFTLLVERYVHLVYSAAMRQVCNPSHAEEITQAVFIILTQKAKSLSPKTILSGWLYQTARLTAANFLRSESLVKRSGLWVAGHRVNRMVHLPPRPTFAPISETDGHCRQMIKAIADRF